MALMSKIAGAAKPDYYTGNGMLIGCKAVHGKVEVSFVDSRATVYIVR